MIVTPHISTLYILSEGVRGDMLFQDALTDPGHPEPHVPAVPQTDQVLGIVEVLFQAPHQFLGNRNGASLLALTSHPDVVMRSLVDQVLVFDSERFADP